MYAYWRSRAASPGSPQSWYQSHPDFRRPQLAWTSVRKEKYFSKNTLLLKLFFYLRKPKYSFHCSYLFNLFYTLPLSVKCLLRLYFYYLVSIQTCILDDVPRKAKIFVYPKKKKQLSQDINARVIHIEERRIATTPGIEVVSPSSFRMDLNEEKDMKTPTTVDQNPQDLQDKLSYFS